MELAWFLKTDWRRKSVFLDPDHEDEDEDGNALSATGVALVPPGRLHQAAARRH